MGVKPNLVVGLIGAVVFLVTVSLIVSGFRELTSIRTYQSDFDSFSARLPQRANTLGGGTASRNEGFGVPHHNLTTLTVRLTWEETFASSHDVSLVVKDPPGGILGQASGRGGTNGLTVRESIRLQPTPERFNEVSNRIDEEFYERYGDHAEDAGVWGVQILSNGPGGPTDTGVSYTISFDYQYWVGSYAEIPELTK